MQFCPQLKYIEIKGEMSEELSEDEKRHLGLCKSCSLSYLNKIDENRKLKRFLINCYEDILTGTLPLETNIQAVVYFKIIIF